MDTCSILDPKTTVAKSGYLGNKPSISVVLPVYNSEKVLHECLSSIIEQDYDRERLEIIIIDGGSSDRTIEIARAHNVDMILENPLKTGEAGKAVGLKASNNEIVALIDSDNILPDRDWLLRMIEPFDDPEIIASEPISYTYRKTDGLITRYCALLGMNDPLCLFLGNYDRHSALTDKWTEMSHDVFDEDSYLKVSFDKHDLPTIGANGFLIRREALENYIERDYFFDIDILHELMESPGAEGIKIAKVKTGIVHIFSGNSKAFAMKQKRRVRDYIFYSKQGQRKYPWNKSKKAKIFKFIFYCLTTLPLLAQSVKGYLKKRDNAWFFHPIACWITLWEYGTGRTISIFKAAELERKDWQLK